ncbi:MAG TPA: hypothetical protein VFW52_02375 [Candidatus Saccharimonadales bacterium]|nr:hypothetical protein [Candidatus Saccharimonadales bacterium]
MNPYELLESFEEKGAAEGLTDGEKELLRLVRKVVKRIAELETLLFMSTPEGEKDKHLDKHDVEMREYVYLYGPAIFGDLKPTPPHEELGVADKDTAIKNARLWARREEARKEGWLIEAVALTAYELEEWLRIWIASQGGGDFYPDDNWTLGSIIAEAEKHRLDLKLLERLKKFNKTRKRAIHRLLRGEIAYEELGKAYDLDLNLPEDLKRWIVKALPNFAEASPEWDSIGKWSRWDRDPSVVEREFSGGGPKPSDRAGA